MEKIFVEKLIDQKIYYFELQQELPICLPTTHLPRLKSSVHTVDKILRIDGLLVTGIIVEEIEFEVENKLVEDIKNLIFQVDMKESFFSYLIPETDLVTTNLLNIIIDLQIEKVDYHLVEKRGQVFISRRLQMKLKLNQYTIENISVLTGGIKKKHGLFLKKNSSLEKSFLKTYPINLPPDFLTMVNLTGKVDEVKLEVINSGCIIDFNCHFQATYINKEGKVETFFFIKEEHFFLPISITGELFEIKKYVHLKEFSLEENQFLALYHLHLDFYTKTKRMFFTKSGPTQLKGAIFKDIEVEELVEPLTGEQLIEVNLDLSHLDITRVIKISGELFEVNVERLPEAILISGYILYQCFYLDSKGVEREFSGKRKIEEMLLGGINLPGEQLGFPELTSSIQIPTWDFSDGRLNFTIIIDYQVVFHFFSVQPVLIDLSYDGIIKEKFYLSEKVQSDKFHICQKEKIYLYRYAGKILNIEGQLSHWEVRAVDDGWILNVKGDLVIYFTAENKEFHLSHSFNLHHYLSLNSGSHFKLRMIPEIKILNHRLLEDGSLLEVIYLIWFSYLLLEKQEGEIVLGFKKNLPSDVNLILKNGEILHKLSRKIYLKEENILPDKLKEVKKVDVEQGKYHINFSGDNLILTGDLLIKVSYCNILGSERRIVIPLALEVVEKIGFEGESELEKSTRAIWGIKSFEYSINYLTDHPHKVVQIDLFIVLVIHYRIFDSGRRFWQYIFPEDGSTN